jgi:hypothetical protein
MSLFFHCPSVVSHFLHASSSIAFPSGMSSSIKTFCNWQYFMLQIRHQCKLISARKQTHGQQKAKHIGLIAKKFNAAIFTLFKHIIFIIYCFLPKLFRFLFIFTLLMYLTLYLRQNIKSLIFTQ